MRSGEVRRARRRRPGALARLLGLPGLIGSTGLPELPGLPGLLGLLALTGGVLAAGAATVQDARAVTPPGAAAAQAQPAATDEELTRLSGRLADRARAVLRDRCLAGARVGVTVRDLETGRTLFDTGGSEPLVPASNQKLVTGAALLALLGPEHVIRTRFEVERPPADTGGVGQLWMVGAGDPALTVEQLHVAARALAAAGVRRVERVVADASYFDESTRPASWPERHSPFWYGAPSAALGTNFNVVAVHARGTSRGAPAQAWLEPFPSFFEVENRLTTGRGAWRVGSELLDTPTVSGARQRLTLTGRVAPGETARQLRSVEDPPLYAAHAMGDALRRMGIAVSAPPAVGVVPEDAVLLHAQPSKPMALLVHDMNKVSSNVFAETLVRVLGAELLGPPGTTEKGLAVVRRFLEALSDDAPRAVLADASGLADDNRLTSRLLTDVLAAMRRDPLVGPEFVVALPIGNVDGTLSRRLGPSEGRRLVRAKTGRLRGAISLSGYAPVADGRPAVFSIVVNDYPCPTWKAQAAVDRLVGAIVAEVPRASEPAEHLPLDEIRAALAATAARSEAAEEKRGESDGEAEAASSKGGG